MAKKKKLELDDYGFSSELDIPDFNLEAPELKDNRSPITKVSSAALSGAMDTFTDPAFIVKVAKEALPRGYGETYDFANETAGTLKSLYNDSIREIKPVIKDIKRVTGRLLPAVDPILPKGISDKIKAWSKSDQSNRQTAELGAEQQRDLSLQMQLGDIFKMETQMDARRHVEGEIKEKIRENIDQNRHQDQLSQFDAIRLGVQTLANYKTNIESKYQRKSLELQFRHYFVAADMLQEQKRQNVITTESLGIIAKNTGLPEYAKLRNTERFSEMMRNKFMESATDGLLGRRRETIRKIGAKFATNIKDKLSGFLDNVKTGITAADGIADAREMTEGMQDMGGPSGVEMAGGMAGGLAADTLGGKIGKWLKLRFGNNETLNRVGNKLLFGVENNTQLIKEAAMSDKGDNVPFIGDIIRSGKDAALSVINDRGNTDLIKDSVGGMQNPEMGTRQVNKTITEIIPGYLSRIHKELLIIRTGNPNVDLMSYDYTKNRFSTQDKIDKNVVAQVIKKSDKESVTRSIEDLITEVAGNSLTPEKRKALGKFMLSDNLNNGVASKERLSNYSTFNKDEASKYSQEFSRLFEKYFEDDNTNSKQIDFSRKYSQLGAHIEDGRKVIQDHVNLGNSKVLEKMGIIKDGRIDLKKLESYYYDGPDSLGQNGQRNTGNPNPVPPSFVPPSGPSRANDLLDSLPPMPPPPPSSSEPLSDYDRSVMRRRTFSNLNVNSVPTPTFASSVNLPTVGPLLSASVPTIDSSINTEPEVAVNEPSVFITESKKVFKNVSGMLKTAIESATKYGKEYVDKLSTKIETVRAPSVTPPVTYGQTFSNTANLNPSTVAANLGNQSTNAVPTQAVQLSSPSPTVSGSMGNLNPQAYPTFAQPNRVTPVNVLPDTNVPLYTSTTNRTDIPVQSVTPTPITDPIVVSETKKVFKRMSEMFKSFTDSIPTFGKTPAQAAAPVTPVAETNADTPAINLEPLNKTASSILETLLRIETKIETGTGTGTGNSTSSAGSAQPKKSRWWNKSLMETVSDVGSAGFGAAKAIGRFGNSAVSQVFKNGSKLLSGAGNIVGKAAKWAVGGYEKMHDVYIAGKNDPALLAWKVKAGHYRDVATGKIIKSVKDITGAIEDISDPENIKTVIASAEEAKTAFVKAGKTVRSKLISTLGATIKSGKDLASGIASGLPIFYKTALNVGTKAVGMLRRPIDVYVKGKSDPVLLAITMKAGGYKSAVSGKTIKSLRDIDGPVVDLEGTVRLSAEDLAGGMFNKDGKPLKTIGKRLTDLAMRAVKGVASTGKKLGDKALGIGKDIFGKMKIGIPKIFGGQILSNNQIGFGLSGSGGGGAGNNKLLKQIRDILNARLPGEPTEFDDTELSVGTMLGGGAAAAKNKLKGLFSRTKDRVNSIKESGGFKEVLKTKTKSLTDTVAKSSLVAKAKEKLSAVTDKVKGNSLVGKAFSKVASLWGKTKDMFGSFAKKDGLQVSGIASMSALLKQIRDNLSPKKKMLGDTDGDGIREGSYQDLIRKKWNLKGKGKEEEGKGKDGARYTGGKSLAATIAEGAGALKDKASDAWDKYQDYRAGKATVDDLRGSRPPAPPGTPPGSPPPRPRGRFSKAMGVGGKVLGTLGKVAGVAGAAYGAYSAYDNIKQGNYGSAALDGALTVGGLAASGATLAGTASVASTIGAGALSIGGSLLAGIGTVLASPVVLGALAVGAVGVGSYYAYKYLTTKRLDKLSKIRYAQYGFVADDKDSLGPVFGLEDNLKRAIVYKDGVASIDDKKVKIEKLIKDFGIGLDDEKSINKWAKWFQSRFKPVFLTHLTAMQKVNPKVSMDNADSDLSPSEKQKYLDLIKYPDGPYNYFDSPFNGQKSLKAGTREISAYIDLASAEIQKEMKGSKDGDKTKSLATAAAGTAVAATAAVAKQSAKKPATLNEQILADIEKQSSSLDDAEYSKGMLSATGVAMQSAGRRKGVVDGLTAIRFKAYGLVELSADKVECLDKVEATIAKDITFQKDIASWKGTADTILGKLGPMFGVEGLNNNNAYDWLSWFNLRFLPTYLNYATSIMGKTGKENPIAGEMTLKATDAVEVALATYTSKSKYNGRVCSVWEIPVSPWPDYELNSDIKSIDKNLDGLKAKAKQVVLDEAKVSEVKSTNKPPAPPSNTPVKPGSPAKPMDTSSFVSGSGNAQGMASDTIKKVASSVPTLAGPTGGTMSGVGNAIANVGSGSGGLVDTLPMPTENGTWKGLKDLIKGAAKMVGIDDKLMATIAAIESGFNYTVKAGTSSATGLFQFISSTWSEMVKKYGAKYGISSATSPTDPRANALMGGEFLKANAGAIKSAVGNRPVTDVDLYLAHFMGAGGAKKFLSAPPDTPAAQIFPKEAAANPSIFYEGGKSTNRAKTVSEIYSHFNGLIRAKGKRFGIDAGSGAEPILPSAAKEQQKTFSNIGRPEDAPGLSLGMAATKKPTLATSGGVTSSSYDNRNTSSTSSSVTNNTTNSVSNVQSKTSTTIAPAPLALAASSVVKTVGETGKPSSESGNKYLNPNELNTKPTEEIKSPVVPVKPPSSFAPGVLAAGSGFTTPKPADIAIQQQYQRELVAESLSSVEKVLGHSLVVQKEQRDILKQIRDNLLLKKVASVEPDKKEPAETKQSSVSFNAPKRQEQVARAPVSMARPAY